MKDYISKTFKRVKDDAFSMAIYDIGKYIIVVIVTYIVLKSVPNNSSLGSFLNTKTTLTYFQISIFIFFAIVITIIIQFLINKKKFAVIKKDLFTDELTGLKNGRALIEELNEAISWSKREKRNLSLILMDIDNFKKFNDEYSQNVADNVLRKFGTFLKSDNRITDTIYRQHVKGDEFVIITRDTILENAIKAAYRKKELIAQTGIKLEGFEKAFNLTVCCGVVELDAQHDDENGLMKRAYSAMRTAKDIPGKNHVVSLI